MNVTEPRAFFDTNILVYAHDNGAGEKHDRARALVLESWAAETGYLSTQVLQEFYVTVTRKLSQPLEPEIARRLVVDLAAWTVHQPSTDDIVAAIEFHQAHSVSYWDALILQSASRLGCGVLWSEDLNHGQVYGTVTVRNPFA